MKGNLNMKKKFLILPLLALSVGALSGCTKDDLAAFQSQANEDIEALKAEDSNLQSQIDEIKGDVASLKSQIASLKTELEGKIDEAKADYNAKVQAAQGKIDENKAAIQTLSTNFQTKEAELKAELEAEIAGVDAKYEGYITGENGINDQIAALQAALEAAQAAIQEDLDALAAYDESFYAEYVSDYNSFVNAVNSLYQMIQTLNTNLTTLSQKHDSDLVELTNALNAAQEEISQAIASVRSDLDDLSGALDDAYEELENDIIDLGNWLSNVEGDLEVLTDRVNSLEAQIVQEKAAIQADYNEKIDDLRDEMNAEAFNLQCEIDELEDLIEMYAVDLQDQIDDLVDYFGGLIDGLTDRIGDLEDVPVYTVTFDLNYDLWDGTIPEKHTVQVLKGDKVEEYLPARPGMTLTEWTYEDTGKPWSFFGYVVTEDMELHAQWEAEEGATHTYDYANPKVFEKETLEKAGHVRYRCTAHSGGSCYIDVREKAGKTFIAGTYSTSSNIYFRGVIEQGRFYVGQTVTLQMKNGTLENHKISSIYVSSRYSPVALVGDTAMIYFTRTDMNLSSGNFNTIVQIGDMVTKGDEAILSNQFDVNIHLFDDSDVDLYPAVSVVPLTSPNSVSNGTYAYMSYGNVKRLIRINDIETEDDSGVIYVGKDGTASLKISDNKAALHLQEGEIVYLYNYNSTSNAIGYVEITSHNLILPVFNNYAESPSIAFLESFDSDGYGYQVYVPEYAEDIFGADIPLYKNFQGFNKKYDASCAPDAYYDDWEYYTTSCTMYANFTYAPNLIFDDSFVYEYVDGVGLKVTGYFLNAGVWNLAVGDEVSFYDVWDYYYDREEKSVTAQITKIEVDTDEFVNEFTGVNPSGTNEVSIYFNTLSESFFSDVKALCINKDAVAIDPNYSRGGVNSDGHKFACKYTIDGKTLPTAKDYTAASRKLLGFSVTANDSTATYAPGAVYNGTRTLYAIWGEEIFAGQVTANSQMSGCPALKVTIKSGTVHPGQFVYIESTVGVVKFAVAGVMGVSGYCTSSEVNNYLNDQNSAQTGDQVWLHLAVLSSEFSGSYFSNLGRMWIAPAEADDYLALQVLDVMNITGRGTAVKVVLNKDLENVSSSAYALKYLYNRSVGNTVITGMAADNNGQPGSSVIENASAGDTVWVLLRGVNATGNDMIRVGTAMWRY